MGDRRQAGPFFVEVTGRLLDAGHRPPILRSANLDGGDAANHALLDRLTFDSSIAQLTE